jgi:two-component system CheB/CheR fusion protein
MTFALKQNNQMEDTSPETFPVVGVGASAGGLAAFKAFLSAIPADSNMAYVLVQHLSPKHESALAELVQQSCIIPVKVAQHNMTLEPNQVYVIPPNCMLTTVDGRLNLEPIKNRRIKIIDRFFSSLGIVHQSFAVGVILSGAMDDGTLGLQVIKSSGGITFAQEVRSADHGSMPESAIKSGAVDFVLPAEEIIPKLLQINQPFNTDYSVQESEQRTPQAELEIFKQLLAVLRIRRGVDFSNYKQSTIKRRIIRRMALNKIEEAAEYLRFLRDTTAEQDLLYNDLLISVTSFFRDTSSFETLCTHVLPAILNKKRPSEPLRIWVAGCATGEEAYTFAICILEHLGDRAFSRKIQIFATDISETAIAKARIGVYSATELSGLSNQQIVQFFNKVDGNYQVSKALRDLCVFAHHNLVKDAPFSNLDLVSCRNVLIYLDTPLQKKALATFHYGLHEHGFLMLGRSESVNGSADMFSPTFPQEKIYQTKGMKGRYRNITSSITEGAMKDFDRKDEKSSRAKDIHVLADNVLLAKYTPPGVLLDGSFEVVEFRGRTDQWLVVPPGRPSFNILTLAREGLSFEIRSLLHLAKTSQMPAKKERVFFKFNDVQEYVDIDVIPITELEEIHFLVLFQASRQSLTPALHTEPAVLDTAKVSALLERNAQLEKELSQTREDMRAITEAQEAANEELQSANEELLSGNEELQSLNDELEKSKEALQSINEEISIVNTELLDRNEQLNNARKYNEEIFNTIHDPLLILDSSLKVLRATDGFYRLFRLREEEVEGKYVYELSDGKWKIPSLKNQLSGILPKQGFVKDFEAEINTGFGRRTLMLSARQFTPHNQQQVIILAVHDITDSRKVEEGLAYTEQLLEESQERLYFAMESAGVGAWDFDPISGRLIWDQRCKALHGLHPSEPITYSKYLNQIFPEDRDYVAIATHKSLIREPDNSFNVEYRLIDLGDGKEHWLKSKGKAYFDKEKVAVRFIGTVTDISAEKRIARQTLELTRKKDEFIAFASHELKTPITSIKGIIQILDRSVSKGNLDRAKELTGRAERQVDRFTKLVDQLLEGTSMQSGELELHKSYFAILELIQACTRNPVYNREDVQFEISGAPDIIVYADRSRMEQVFMNLVNNAVKYAPDSNLIQIGVTVHDEVVRVEVKDFGIGMDKKKLPFVFERFYRGDEQHGKFPGLGLGLFIAAEIIDKHQGKIGVESEPGKGSTFWFSLPAKGHTNA